MNLPSQEALINIELVVVSRRNLNWPGIKYIISMINLFLMDNPIISGNIKCLINYKTFTLIDNLLRFFVKC